MKLTNIRPTIQMTEWHDPDDDDGYDDNDDYSDHYPSPVHWKVAARKGIVDNDEYTYVIKTSYDSSDTGSEWVAEKVFEDFYKRHPHLTVVWNSHVINGDWITCWDFIKDNNNDDSDPKIAKQFIEYLNSSTEDRGAEQAERNYVAWTAKMRSEAARRGPRWRDEP